MNGKTKNAIASLCAVAALAFARSRATSRPAIGLSSRTWSSALLGQSRSLAFPA